MENIYYNLQESEDGINFWNVAGAPPIWDWRNAWETLRNWRKKHQEKKFRLVRVSSKVLKL